MLTWHEYPHWIVFIWMIINEAACMYCIYHLQTFYHYIYLFVHCLRAVCKSKSWARYVIDYGSTSIGCIIVSVKPLCQSLSLWPSLWLVLHVVLHLLHCFQWSFKKWTLHPPHTLHISAHKNLHTRQRIFIPVMNLGFSVLVMFLQFAFYPYSTLFC